MTHCGVLRAGCDAAVIKWIPLDVQHIPTVATHARVVAVDFPCLPRKTEPGMGGG